MKSSDVAPIAWQCGSKNEGLWQNICSGFSLRIKLWAIQESLRLSVLLILASSKAGNIRLLFTLRHKASLFPGFQCWSRPVVMMMIIKTTEQGWHIVEKSYPACILTWKHNLHCSLKGIKHKKLYKLMFILKKTIYALTVTKI